MEAHREHLKGNRIALVGAVVYLMEWLVIVPSGAPDPVENLTTSPTRLVGMYAQHRGGVAVLVAWLSFVLLGRIAFAVGLRAALPRSSKVMPLMDLAVAAMVVSVVFELSGLAMAGAAGTLAGRGVDPVAVVALNGAAAWITQLLFVPLGVFVGLASVEMLTSRLFPRWLAWLGVVGGLALTAGGMLVVAILADGTSDSISYAPIGLGVPVFWLWMLATGVLLFKKVGLRTVEQGSAEASASA